MEGFDTPYTMAKSKALPETPLLPPTYEAAVQELETLLARLEAGQLPLDELLSQYQRGEVLLRFCRERLAAVEEQVQVLDGGALRPWTEGGSEGV